MGVHVFEPEDRHLVVDLTLVESILDRYGPARRVHAEAACLNVASRARNCVCYMSPDTSWLSSMLEAGFRIFFECFFDSVVILDIQRDGSPLPDTEGAFIVTRNSTGHAFRYPGANGGPSATLLLVTSGERGDQAHAGSASWIGRIPARCFLGFVGSHENRATGDNHDIRTFLSWIAAHGLVARDSRRRGSRDANLTRGACPLDFDGRTVASHRLRLGVRGGDLVRAWPTAAFGARAHARGVHALDAGCFGGRGLVDNIGAARVATAGDDMDTIARACLASGVVFAEPTRIGCLSAFAACGYAVWIGGTGWAEASAAVAEARTATGAPLGAWQSDFRAS